MEPIKWLEARRRQESMSVRRIDAQECLPWAIDATTLARPDSRYFRGFLGLGQTWISQPEIGTLGFLTSQSGGRGHILVQVKEEPGNTLLSQLAPTVQATKSNIDKVHGGTDQPFLEHFRAGYGVTYSSDTNQSEQGTRFWRKRNRNVLREVGLFETHSASHSWVAFNDFRRALSQSRTVNTDARSVIASSDWTRLLPSDEGAEQDGVWTNLQVNNYPNTPKEYLNAIGRLESFRRTVVAADSAEITHPRDALAAGNQDRWGTGETEFWFFEVIARYREIDSWCQPLLTSRTKPLHKLIITRQNGVLLCLVRLTAESGLLSLAEFGPSVSTSGDLSTGSTDTFSSELTDFLNESGSVLRNMNQSDEGGRFYQQEANYQLVWVHYEDLARAPSFDHFDELGLVWVNLRDLNMLCATSMTTTNELRTLATLLLSLQSDT